MKWQRRLRAGIALFAAGFLVVLYLAFRPAGPASGPAGGGRVVRDDPAASAHQR
jgi:hypothetical protein